MPLFQASVLNSHLRLQDARQLEEAYQTYTAYFHNPVIQENIRNSKEEQFQASFLNELFVKVLGYTLNPNPEYNLTTEFKNESNNRKADGAILANGTAVGVIELKGTNTKDLESIRRQAFDYKANQKGCVYVITSNFEKLRFYVNDATEFLEFNLFELGREEFALLLLCLWEENLLSNLPLKIKEASLVVEEEITKTFYSDYSVFKRELYQDLVTRNLQKQKATQLVSVEPESAPEEEDAEHEKAIRLNLFKKSQKLIDRFLFVFFAEDRNLLPPNSAMQILDKWKADMDFGDERPLYELFRQYFGFLHTGRQSTASRAEIYAYNGGLFKPDEILDTVEIGSEMLYKHTRKLASYDFESQVDVNILGHIFENSLNEIEGMTSEIEGTDFDKQKSKRKKDGVFYTPKYITKYIVENTVGKLCTEKKEALGFREEEYYEGRSKKHKKTILNLVKVLDDYRDWLLQLSICDPACGSGAFLNQALDFLIKEHRYIDELKTKLLGGSLVLSDIETTILENNIYGVDINEESVEIAKLSLWLRTAQPRRKLNDLSSNIKCGNSLIDDPAVAGEKAFKWEEEFPEIFAKGGFDVVIGNPPYLRVQGLRTNFEQETKFYENEYQSATGRFDIYILFIEKSVGLIKNNGLVSLILPHKFLVGEFGEGIRKFLVENRAVDSIIHFGSEMVFADASIYTCIITLSNNNNQIKYKEIKPDSLSNHWLYEIIDYETLTAEKWNLKVKVLKGLFETIRNQPLTVKEVFSAIRTGVDTGSDDIFIMQGKILGSYFHGFSERLNTQIKIESSIVKPMLKGKDVKRYSEISNDFFVIYPFTEVGNKTLPYSEQELKEKYPKTFEYLSYFKEELVEKKIKKKTNPTYWYSLHRGREMSIFEAEKIVTPETSYGGNFTIDQKRYYHNTQVYSLIKNDSIQEDYKFYLALLNSSLFWFFMQNTGAVLRGGYFRFKTKSLEPFPVPKLRNIKLQEPFIAQVDKITTVKKEKDRTVQRFAEYLSGSCQLSQISKKLQSWHILTFGEFLKELNKAIKDTNKVREKEGLLPVLVLTKKDEFEWMDLFEENKKKVLELQQQIDQTDREIDQMVYELYGLTEEEIAVVES